MRDKAGIRSQIRKKIERLPLSAFSAPYLLVCEAISEAWFFFRLFDNRNIVNFIIDYPLIEGRKAGTLSASSTTFGEYLRGLKTEIQLNPGKLKAIILESDNDLDPVASFRSVQSQIEEAGNYGVPTKPYQLVESSQGYPPLMVVMLPSADKQGALEHLFLPVACEASGKISNCFSELMKCCGAEVWGEIKQAKMQLRMLISAQWRDDPNISLSFLWQKDKCKDLIPITHKSFDPLAGFFKEFDIGRKNNEAKI